MKRRLENYVSNVLRIALVALAVLLQVGLFILLTYFLRDSAIYVYMGIQILALLQIMVLVSRNKNDAFTIAWVLIIALLPVFGYVLYLVWGRSDVHGRRPQRLRDAFTRSVAYLHRNPRVYARLNKEHPTRKRVAGYLGRQGFPLYQNTACEYYALGEHQFEALKKDLAEAQKFILISTFILSSGRLWDDEICPLLAQRAAAGVEVRLMFDDFGSILTVPGSILRDLEAKGIKALRFNPIHKFVSKFYMHYRNHQKIISIDSNIGYTGGTNFSDEYANYYEKHGHWKDTAIRLEGDAVWSLTDIFLSMWEGETGDLQDYDAYRPTQPGDPEAMGFFQPFADGPVNNPENPAETMYRKLIDGATEYVYITSPYLVINNNMMQSLCTAAASGVDVRIITPKKWDHWYVHAVSRSNYKPLLQAGARVFEYTPGFIHAKTVLSDGDHCVTGSINMDYRSFYLHFENGVWICGAPVLRDIKADFTATLAQCEEIRWEEYCRRPWWQRGMEGFLRVFAVLL